MACPCGESAGDRHGRSARRDRHARSPPWRATRTRPRSSGVHATRCATIQRMPADPFASFFTGRGVFLAPMEDVTDAAFRAVCRRRGAHLAYTEFVNVDHLVAGSTVES